MCTTGVLRIGPDDYLLFQNKDFGQTHFGEATSSLARQAHNPTTGRRGMTVTARSKGATAEQVRQWASAAARQAVVSDAEDTEYLVATVEGCPGAWAYGTTAEDAVAYLESVLIGWADLKLADGDTDIPVMGGISLATEP